MSVGGVFPSLPFWTLAYGASTWRTISVTFRRLTFHRPLHRFLKHHGVSLIFIPLKQRLHQACSKDETPS